MKRLIVAVCVGTATMFMGSLAGVALAQPLPETTGRDSAAAPVRSIAPPTWNDAETLPPLPAAPPAALPPTSPVPSPAATPSTAPATVPAAPAPYRAAAPQLAPYSGSPGDTQATPETRAHEYHLLQAQAAEDSVHRAAIARAEQRTRRVESQRWFGISNKRPVRATDPYDGDYSAYWASNYPFYPLRWVGGSAPWGFVEVQP